MRNPPHNRVSQNAIAFVNKLPSIGELFLTNGTAFDRELSAPVPVERTGTLELDDALYNYGITADGRAAIVSCESKAAELVVPAAFEGAPTCIVGTHSFSTCYSLERVELPDCVEEIHGFSFMNSALTEFVAPASLELIGCKAFYKCKHLERVTLNEGLLAIGDSAFRESALATVGLPSTLEGMGQGVFDCTGIRCGDQGLSVSLQNARFRLIDGALYEIGDAGWTLHQLIDEEAETYEFSSADEGSLICVADRAFADKKKLRSIHLPEGVLVIGESAFRGCPQLVDVHLPATVESLGAKAFWETAVPELNIPAALCTVGTAAFHTGGTVSGARESTVRFVSVEPDNPVFYVKNGMLCARTASGESQVLLYTGQGVDDGNVVIPAEATSIGPYAFSNVKGLRSIRMHNKIHTVDISGFDFGAIVPDIHFDDLDTGKTYTVHFPPGNQSYMYMRQAFNRGGFVLEEVYELLDRAVMVTRDTFTRARAMLDRMLDPVFLPEGTFKQYRERLTGMLEKAVVEFGRNGYPQGIDQLLEVGVLREDNIETAIDAALGASEVAVLSRLMEIRRTEFGAALFDFDL